MSNRVKAQVIRNYCISKLICVLWLVNLAGCTPLHGLLKFKVFCCQTVAWFIDLSQKFEAIPHEWNIYLTNLVFSIPTVSCRSSIFPYRGKNLVCNLRYGPQTRLLRGIYTTCDIWKFSFKLHSSKGSRNFERI